MKVPVGRKALCQQFGANHLAILEDEASASFVREHRSSDSGDNKRVAETEQDRRHKGKANRSCPD
jgi:hypothetical protein